MRDGDAVAGASAAQTPAEAVRFRAWVETWTGRIDLECAHGTDHPSEVLTRARARRWNPDQDAPHVCRCACCGAPEFALAERAYADAWQAAARWQREREA